MTRDEALARALDWAEGRLSHINTVHAETQERRMEVVAVMDALEVVKWSALAAALPAVDAPPPPQCNAWREHPLSSDFKVRCDLREGHVGPHANGMVEWRDDSKYAIPPVDAPPEPTT